MSFSFYWNLAKTRRKSSENCSWCMETSACRKGAGLYGWSGSRLSNKRDLLSGWVEYFLEMTPEYLSMFDITDSIHREYSPTGQTATWQFYVGVLEKLWVLIFRPLYLAPRKRTYPIAPISPSVTFLFAKIKSHFKGSHHGGEQEVMEAVTAVLNGLTSEDYQGRFQSWK